MRARDAVRRGRASLSQIRICAAGVRPVGEGVAVRRVRAAFCRCATDGCRELAAAPAVWIRQADSLCEDALLS